MASANKEYFWDCHSRRLFCPLPPHQWNCTCRNTSSASPTFKQPYFSLLIRPGNAHCVYYEHQTPRSLPPLLPLVILFPALSHPPKHNFQTTMEKIPILLRGVYPFFPCHVLLFGTGDLGGSHPRHGSPLWLSHPPAGTFLSGARTVLP